MSRDHEALKQAIEKEDIFKIENIIKDYSNEDLEGFLIYNVLLYQDQNIPYIGYLSELPLIFWSNRYNI